MTIFYFTGTGNSLYVAKCISEHLISIPQALKEGLEEYEDDVVGFVYPTYGHTAPKIVKEFIAKVQVKSRYIFAIATCSHVSTTAASNLEINLSYEACVEMAGNHIPMVDIELEKSIDKRVDEQIKKIKMDISKKTVKLQNASTKEKVVAKLINIFHGGIPCKKFYIVDTCVGCGTCAKVCPRGNINIDTIPSFNNSCEGCLSCVHNCPKKAIKVKCDKNPESRYRNNNIRLNEIMKANKVI